MTLTDNLLIEIGTADMPSKPLPKIAEAFKTGIMLFLEQKKIPYKNMELYFTPRRIALLIKDIAIKQPDILIEKKGPSEIYDKDGKISKAALGFAKSCNVNFTELEQVVGEKSIILQYKALQKGLDLKQLLPDMINNVLKSLPIPKPMRWGSNEYEFIRPVYWSLVMIGTEIINMDIMGTKTSNQTYGHRFHAPLPIIIDDVCNYSNILFKAKVVSSFKERCEIIKKQVLQIAQKANAIAVIDETLVEEIANLVEWPVAVLGNFDKNFLQVPSEALILTMKYNQKYFHLVNKENCLLPQFIAISNIESQNIDIVIKGNEKVIRPRFSDAKFFWEQDLLKPLINYTEQLKTVVFQNKLGTTYDKVQRVAKLAIQIGELLNIDVNLCQRAAELSKCDLMTNMVGEFPELQGIMGEYYALHFNENAEVAKALKEQYLPRFAGDELASSKIGQVLAIAEKIDTLVGIFGIDQAPTGDKDPFALRRASIGLLRMLVELKLSLNLKFLLKEAMFNYNQGLLKINTDMLVYDFIIERLRHYYLEQNISYDVVEAVLSCSPEILIDADLKIKALVNFKSEPNFISLSSANKRINNILKKIDVGYNVIIDDTLFVESEEKKLFTEIINVESNLNTFIKEKNYHAAFLEIANLQMVVNTFFDKVMVMVENEKIKNNRISLLIKLKKLFLKLADISKLQ